MVLAHKTGPSGISGAVALSYIFAHVSLALMKFVALHVITCYNHFPRFAASHHSFDGCELRMLLTE